MSDLKLAQIGALNRAAEVPANRMPANRAAFREALESLRAPATAGTGATASAEPLKFSNHAVDRMISRGIRFTPDQLQRIEGAIERAAAKGARNTLLLTEEAAMIVSVKDKNVVTVMDKAGLKENVFTNIDSTVVVG